MTNPRLLPAGAQDADPWDQALYAFLIEKGKLHHGLLNFRFNQSLIEMLANVEEMSEPVHASGEESIDMVVPAMKVRDFNFTERTTF